MADRNVKIQTPPGMRDFYPDDMRLQRWLFDAWRNVSEAFGFEEYEGPIFEYLDLYTIKSGEGIVSELFNFEDRGGRRFAIRPEMTPTLARMVAAKANALPKPLKWYSIPRMCRAERPQKGRLREFFQWNVDVLGTDDPLADAEVIAVAADLFRRIDVGPEHVEIRWSDRRLAAAVLRDLKLADELHADAFAMIDRVDKLPAEAFDEAWDQKFGTVVAGREVRDMLTNCTLDDALKRVGNETGGENLEKSAGRSLSENLAQLQTHLESLGVADYCRFDLKIVRGLAYYTGVVFEAYPKSVASRALLGGGRYDNLTGLMGGPAVPGVGFGAGDAPLFEFLKEIDRLPTSSRSLDVFLIDSREEFFADVLALAARLRAANIAADFSYKRQAVGKQMKQADSRGAKYVIVFGDEYREAKQVQIRSLETGTTSVQNLEEFLAKPGWTLGRAIS
ncbi:MAG: histidine--tRNA ligase [Phycisphaerae bacterium]